MYEILIKEYLKKLTLNDIKNFALKYNFKLQPNEDKIIYNFIMNNWKEIYKGNPNKSFLKLKGQVSSNTYNFAITLYNQFKDKIN